MEKFLYSDYNSNANAVRRRQIMISIVKVKKTDRKPSSDFLHLAHSVGASSSSVRLSTALVGGAHCAGVFALATTAVSCTPAPVLVPPFGAAPPVPPILVVAVVVVVSTVLPAGVEVAVVIVLLVSTVLFAPPGPPLDITLFVSIVVFVLVVFDELLLDPIPNFDIRDDMMQRY